MPIGAGGSTRNDCRPAAEPPQPVHSCRLLQDLTGLRLPVCEEIIDIDVRFQLSFFLVGQLTFIGSDIQLFNTGRVRIGEVKSQNAFSERRCHPTSGQVEHPKQHLSVRFGAKPEPSHLAFILRLRAGSWRHQSLWHTSNQTAMPKSHLNSGLWTEARIPSRFRSPNAVLGSMPMRSVCIVGHPQVRPTTDALVSG